MSEGQQAWLVLSAVATLGSLQVGAAMFVAGLAYAAVKHWKNGA